MHDWKVCAVMACFVLGVLYWYSETAKVSLDAANTGLGAVVALVFFGGLFWIAFNEWRW